MELLRSYNHAYLEKNFTNPDLQGRIGNGALSDLDEQRALDFVQGGIETSEHFHFLGWLFLKSSNSFSTCFMNDSS